jgi:VanZ family protein
MKGQHWLDRHPLLNLWLPVVVWMGLIFYLSAQPDLPRPEASWASTLVGSGAHMFVFGVLAVLWARALGRRRWTLLWAFLFTALYALLDEFHQTFVPGRHADPLDLACDAAGAMLGLWGWVWLQRRLASARPGRLVD